MFSGAGAVVDVGVTLPLLVLLTLGVSTASNCSFVGAGGIPIPIDSGVPNGATAFGFLKAAFSLSAGTPSSVLPLFLENELSESPNLGVCGVSFSFIAKGVLGHFTKSDTKGCGVAGSGFSLTTAD